MKPTLFLLVLFVTLFVAALGLNSLANIDNKNDVQQDTTKVSYWKNQALKFEALAQANAVKSKKAQTFAEEEAKHSKKLYNESQAKIKELTTQLEECKKGKP